MSSLKAIKQHAVSVGNIQKITNSIKMVAMSKFISAEKQLRKARIFGRGTGIFYRVSKLKLDPKLGVSLVVTSDRGLCGGLHTKVCKQVKYDQKLNPSEEGIVCVGEKAKSLLAMYFKKDFKLVVNGVGLRGPTFKQACTISERVFKYHGWKAATMTFPLYINIMSFDVTKVHMITPQLTYGATQMYAYELNEDDLDYYFQFSSASLIYYALNETFVSELANRITAMTNASRNAGKVKRRLMLEFNRKRQDKITKEIIDIISGLQATAKKKKQRMLLLKYLEPETPEGGGGSEVPTFDISLDDLTSGKPPSGASTETKAMTETEQELKLILEKIASTRLEALESLDGLPVKPPSLETKPSHETPEVPSKSEIPPSPETKVAVEIPPCPIIQESPETAPSPETKASVEMPLSPVIQASPEPSPSPEAKVAVEIPPCPLIQASPEPSSPETKSSIEIPPSTVIQASPEPSTSPEAKVAVEIPPCPVIQASPESAPSSETIASAQIPPGPVIQATPLPVIETSEKISPEEPPIIEKQSPEILTKTPVIELSTQISSGQKNTEGTPQWPVLQPRSEKLEPPKEAQPSPDIKPYSEPSKETPHIPRLQSPLETILSQGIQPSPEIQPCSETTQDKSSPPTTEKPTTTGTDQKVDTILSPLPQDINLPSELQPSTVPIQQTSGKESSPLIPGPEIQLPQEGQSSPLTQPSQTLQPSLTTPQKTKETSSDVTTDATKPEPKP